MLERKDIDAVTVSTPDHAHAVASVGAMKAGKHVYCQKPLAHSIYEVRQMIETAREQKVATQMGNQDHSEFRLLLPQNKLAGVADATEHSKVERTYSV